MKRKNTSNRIKSLYIWKKNDKYDVNVPEQSIVNEVKLAHIDTDIGIVNHVDKFLMNVIGRKNPIIFRHINSINSDGQMVRFASATRENGKMEYGFVLSKRRYLKDCGSFEVVKWSPYKIYLVKCDDSTNTSIKTDIPFRLNANGYTVEFNDGVYKRPIKIDTRNLTKDYGRFFGGNIEKFTEAGFIVNDDNTTISVYILFKYDGIERINKERISSTVKFIPLRDIISLEVKYYDGRNKELFNGFDYNLRYPEILI